MARSSQLERRGVLASSGVQLRAPVSVNKAEVPLRMNPNISLGPPQGACTVPLHMQNVSNENSGVTGHTSPFIRYFSLLSCAQTSHLLID